MNFVKVSKDSEVKTDKKLDAYKQNLRDAESSFKKEMTQISETKAKDTKSIAEDYDILGKTFGVHQRGDLEQIIENTYYEKNQVSYDK